MDENLRQELTAWLEFYQELGIESFSRRPPAPKLGVPKAEAQQSLVPQSEPAPPPTPTMANQKATLETFRPNTMSPKPIVQNLKLSLFEASPATPVPRERETLEQIRADLGDCQRCRLASTRKTIVFGQGNPHAELVFVGEGPGADEDEQGLPFVGRAGQLLNRMMQLVGLMREEVYICNILRCRPPNNRPPQPEEAAHCREYLEETLDLVRPRYICALGATAAKYLLGTTLGITKMRGKFYDYRGIPVMCTFHPSYLLRDPTKKKEVWDDMKALLTRMGKPVPQR